MFDKLLARLKSMTVKGATVVVGYSAPHAVRVHEDMEMRHPHGGKAKFLSDPAIEQATAMGVLIAAAGKDVEAGLRAAGEHLLEASQEQVPVRTGELRDSGYVEVV